VSGKLKRRVGGVGSNHKKAMAAYTPVQGSAPVTGGAASPSGAPGVMPLAQVTVYPAPGGEYSTIAYQGLAPIFTSGSLGGGAAVPATSPGRWAQLISAGRP
jgi:hypothetical protein